MAIIYLLPPPTYVVSFCELETIRIPPGESVAEWTGVVHVYPSNESAAFWLLVYILWVNHRCIVIIGRSGDNACPIG